MVGSYTRSVAADALTMVYCCGMPAAFNKIKIQQRIAAIITLMAVLVSGMSFFGVVPAQAAGASFTISPNTGVYEVGSLIDISFILDTGGESVNAINADIVFPADKLQVVNPAASTSFISIWVTAPTYSNTEGTINLQGGLPNPGINTNAGVISTVTFRVKGPGKAVIKYSPASKALRNDGEGTNILTATGTAELVLKNPPPSGPVVTSPTHSDANQWYNNPSVQFSWESLDGAQGYSSVFDQTAKTVPDENITTTETSASVRAEGDGIWYFHLRAKTDIWGGVTTYAVQIDVSPPATFTPSLDKNLLTIEETGTLRFLTTDGASGIDHYEVRQVTKAGDGSTNTLFVEASSPYVINRLAAGEYSFLVRAFDRAGNVTEGNVSLSVIAGGLPFYARTPFLRNPAVANILLIVLILLVLVTIGIIVLRRIRIRSTFQHDLHALEHDAYRKYRDLQEEMEELRRAQQLVQRDMSNVSPQPPAAPPRYPPNVPPQP